MSGTSAEQFALLGAVFLILGGTFVFAPQIISAVNGFLAAVFRRPKKVPAPARVSPAESSAPPPGTAHAPQGASEWAAPANPDEGWAPQPAEEPSSAVARLREEIGFSWGREDAR